MKISLLNSQMLFVCQIGIEYARKVGVLMGGDVFVQSTRDMRRWESVPTPSSVWGGGAWCPSWLGCGGGVGSQSH